MPITFADAKNEILVALYRSIRRSDGQIYFSSHEVWKACPAEISRGFINQAVISLAAENFITREVLDDADEVYSLKNKGILKAEELLTQNGLWGTLGDTEPQLISAAGDVESVEAVKAVLDEISQALEQSNDLGDLTPEDVVAAKAEVQSIRTLISATHGRLSLVIYQARATFSWMVEKAGAAAIGELAKKALNMIITWLS